ncbi:MAG: Gfo/Idh/MocA family oxidoreductase [Verrucomicrobiota bacterium]|nr:Gfo/Idh/MocA family oxidoreductase [Verrucomicrobiota bacterium]
MSKSLQIAIIGCGVIGPVHAESFLRNPGVSLRWACDVQADRAARLAEKYNVARQTTSIDEVLADPEVDAVAICTDHYTHAALVASALDAGKHVLCEKPLGISKADLQVIGDAVARNPGVYFGGVLQHRFDPLYRCMKTWVAAGYLGKPVTAALQVQCFRSPDYYKMDKWRGTWAQEGGSVLINQAIHFVDSIQWIMGGASAVCSRCENLGHQGLIETEDTAAVALHFKNGAIGTLSVTSASMLDWEPTLSVYGTDGFIETRNGQLARLQCRDKALEARLITELAAQQEAEKTTVGKDYYGPSHPTQIADFVHAIQQSRQPFVGFNEARQPVEVVLAIYQSNREGRWVNVG